MSLHIEGFVKFVKGVIPTQQVVSDTCVLQFDHHEEDGDVYNFYHHALDVEVYNEFDKIGKNIIIKSRFDTEDEWVHHTESFTEH
jgi:hypothetical protein